MFGLFFTDVPVTSWENAKRADTPAVRGVPPCHARPRRLPRALAVRGGFLSAAHGEREIDATVEAAREAFAALDWSLRFAPVKVLLVTMYFPPAGAAACSAR